MSCSNAFEPGERNADAAGDATTEVLAKRQVIGEVDSGESDDGNIGWGFFVIVLYRNLWDPIWIVGGLWEVNTI